MENIKQALDEIDSFRDALTRIEAFLKTNATKFGVDLKSPVCTSIGLTKPAIYVYAGTRPRELAKQFGGSCEIREVSWDMEFPDFILTFMEAETEKDKVIL
jgi:hypothetical protein